MCQADTESLVDTMKHALSAKEDYEYKRDSSKLAGGHFLPENLADAYSEFYLETMN